MNKSQLGEDDISVKYITPALQRVGWDEDTQIRRQDDFTKGRIIVRGKLVTRGKPEKADFVLLCHSIPIAIIEAQKSVFGFTVATHVGLTATPKETRYVSNIDYIGEPVYRYSLKQGIQDGSLAPYKVIQVHLDVDVEDYRPKRGEADLDGREIEDRHYHPKDYDRSLVIDERTRRADRWITEYLVESGDPMQKTMVFCVDTEHAARMRQALVNENAERARKNSRYVMRITGDDVQGKEQVDNFIDPESRYPVIVTTSRLLSTGVDAQENETLSLEQVTALLDGERVLGLPREIQKVRNAFAGYEHVPDWKPAPVDDLLAAHSVLMAGLLDAAGRFRPGGVGIYRSAQLAHMAPPANRVDILVKAMFAWLGAQLHPLVASCVFHDEDEICQSCAERYLGVLY